MKIASAGSTRHDEKTAVDEAWRQISEKTDTAPRLVYCSASACYEAAALQAALRERMPEGCRMAASSSCLGAMNNQGFCSDEGWGLNLLVFSDDNGAYGVALESQADNPSLAAKRATYRAIDNAGRSGELPELVWVNAAPGAEERVLEGIAEAIGDKVPVIGGSSADNRIEGHWWQFTDDDMESDGVLIIVMYPQARVGLSFHSGYMPTEKTAVVTKSSGRVIHQLDGRPAAEVYNEWLDGRIDAQLAGGNILQQSTMFPLGWETGRIEDIPYYTLMHPEQVFDDGSMSLFANIETGDRVTLMQGSADSLASRAGSVVSGILERHNWQTGQVAGALIVYCAGCMLGIRERMNEVSHGIDMSLGGAPFSGLFTFGEQGCFIDGASRHGNLMISAVVFAGEECACR